MAQVEFDQYIAPVAVAYIGSKPTKKDTVANTGVVWNGFGDIQTVDARAASLLLKHKDVWCGEAELSNYAKALKETAKQEAKTIVEQELPTEDAVVEQEEAVEEQPTEADPKMEAIKSAILNLDSANPDHFSAKGAPKVAAVNVQLPEGMTATAAEITQAFKELGGE